MIQRQFPSHAPAELIRYFEEETAALNDRKASLRTLGKKLPLKEMDAYIKETTAGDAEWLRVVELLLIDARGKMKAVWAHELGEGPGREKKLRELLTFIQRALSGPQGKEALLAPKEWAKWVSDVRAAAEALADLVTGSTLDHWFAKKWSAKMKSPGELVSKLQDSMTAERYQAICAGFRPDAFADELREFAKQIQVAAQPARFGKPTRARKDVDTQYRGKRFFAALSDEYFSGVPDEQRYGLIAALTGTLWEDAETETSVKRRLGVGRKAQKKRKPKKSSARSGGEGTKKSHLKLVATTRRS